MHVYEHCGGAWQRGGDGTTTTAVSGAGVNVLRQAWVASSRQMEIQHVCNFYEILSRSSPTTTVRFRF